MVGESGTEFEKKKGPTLWLLESLKKKIIN